MLAVGGELKNTFCLAARPVRLGEPARRRHGEPRDAARLRALGRASSRDADPASRPSWSPPTPHPGYLDAGWAQRARGGRSRDARRAAPPRPRRRGDGRARPAARRPGHRGRLRRHRLRRPTARSGAARCCSPTTTGSRRSPTCAPCRCPAATRPSASPCRIALAHLRAAGIELAPTTSPPVAACPDARAAGCCARQLGAGHRLRADDEHGPAVRRRRLAARASATRSATRRRRRSSSRAGAGDQDRRAAYRLDLLATGRRSLDPTPARAGRRRRRPRAGSRPALIGRAVPRRGGRGLVPRPLARRAATPRASTRWR